ncbi:alpha/beta hydrolase [Nostoc sp. 2RC]|uniref:alpha/beta hydrolase n=1 Tax=Nostoc sp. 2RC TaxID=2485484 RepID=UPI00162840CB|nr:alpha/beta fold hydrolase [Nostoc sp. 2RC]MBC1239545.1 alpha/beta fold hydrolase [Nostoc sp. 2RC]
MSRMEAFVFQNKRGQNLVGVLHHGQGNEPQPCLIVCHGFAGTKIGGSRRFVEFARYAIKHNFSIFRFDFAGSGDSDGDLVDLTLDRELEDLEAAIDLVTTIDGIDQNAIGLVGHCLGAVTVIRESAKNSKIYKTVAWAPFTDLAGTVMRLIGEDSFSVLEDGDEAEFIYHGELMKCGPAIITESCELDMFKEIEQVHQPLLIIHGTEDATVPLQEVKQLVEQVQITSPNPPKLQIIEGAHHSFPFHQEELFELTIDWFAK